ncbi:MAG TPA: HU family DNA-binding protein [bacterium]|nr:MAG: DNA-binding protein [Candidatus Coatesbacteria bacterium]HDJ30380.1 HU family DNA-binding protein [bacterium]
MTKGDLVKILAKKAKCSKACATACLNTILDEITNALAKGKTVALTGFGTFLVAKRKARTGRNPQTGEKIKIPARKIPRFKPGKQLKKAVK